MREFYILYLHVELDYSVDTSVHECKVGGNGPNFTELLLYQTTEMLESDQKQAEYSIKV